MPGGDGPDASEGHASLHTTTAKVAGDVEWTFL